MGNLSGTLNWHPLTLQQLIRGAWMEEVFLLFEGIRVEVCCQIK